jgi:superfamily II DNA or RNA helicase
LQLPTGSGKTRVLRTVIENHLDSKKTIYVVAHRKQLVKQLSDEIKEAGIKHGIIAAGFPYIKYRVQVCSIQTLIRRIDKLPDPEIILYDEFHHATANSSRKIFEAWPTARVLGVTATPERTDGSPLNDIAEELITGPQVKQLIEGKYLSDYDYFAPQVLDMSGAKKTGGDYNKKQSLELVDKKYITGSAVEHYRKYADRRPSIVCCVSIAHCEHVEKQFIDAGYKAKAVHSKMPKDDIDNSIKGLKTGDLELLIQCELLGEGVDIKGAECLIMLRPTASLIVFLQQVGRVLRVHEGKKGAVILDHVGNWERHGLPDDFREWSLKGKRKKKKELSAYKRCPQCQRPVAQTAKECEYCGFVWTFSKGTMELPQEKEGKLVSIKNINKIDKNKLILEIARRATNLKQAIALAKMNGVDHRGAYYIWTHILKNKIDKKYTTVYHGAITRGAKNDYKTAR